MDRYEKHITYWFKAMWWFTTRKSGIKDSQPPRNLRVRELYDRLGFSTNS